MPIEIPPLSRRAFMASSLAAASSLLIPDALHAAGEPVDPHRFALLSDTHIAADLAAVLRGVTMAEHLRKAVADVAALSPRPAAAFINGDLAFGKGLVEDYSALLDVLAPLRRAALPLYVGLGNHDHRDNFRTALPQHDRVGSAVDARQACVVESPRANWFLLDSLDKTNEVPGTIGVAQLKWLADQLARRADKPALVMVHHNPDREDPTRGGLTDTVALLDLLHAHRNAKALFYGHSHQWSIREENGLHLVNLPAVAYVFQEGMPSGWVDVRLSENGATLELRCVDPAHKQHGEKHDLTWRAA